MEKMSVVSLLTSVRMFMVPHTQQELPFLRDFFFNRVVTVVTVEVFLAKPDFQAYFQSKFPNKVTITLFRNFDFKVQLFWIKIGCWNQKYFVFKGGCPELLQNLLSSNQNKNTNLSKNIEIWLPKTVLALVYKIITVTVDIHKLQRQVVEHVPTVFFFAFLVQCLFPIVRWVMKFLSRGYNNNSFYKKFCCRTHHLARIE